MAPDVDGGNDDEDYGNVERAVMAVPMVAPASRQPQASKRITDTCPSLAARQDGNKGSPRPELASPLLRTRQRGSPDQGHICAEVGESVHSRDAAKRVSERPAGLRSLAPLVFDRHAQDLAQGIFLPAHTLLMQHLKTLTLHARRARRTKRHSRLPRYAVASQRHGIGRAAPRPRRRSGAARGRGRARVARE